MAAMINDSDFPKHYKDWPNQVGFEASQDQPEPVELVVNGTIPASCAGTLYRNGPSSFKVADANTGNSKPFAMSHWFDGFSHLHRFQLVPQVESSSSCKVLYNSRRQVDELIELAHKQGRLKFITFAQKHEPREKFFRKVTTVFAAANLMLYASGEMAPGLMNASVTVHANMPGIAADMTAGKSGIKTLTCMTDANFVKHVGPETLEPIGVVRQTSLHPDLKGALSCAHAQFDPATGDSFNYNLDFGKNPTYRVFRTSAATGQTSILATISDASVKAAYLHSFFLTADYIVLCVWPAILARAAGVKVLWERNIVDAMDFHPDVSVRWYVVDCHPGGRGVVTTYLSPAFFSFHSVNAWQEKAENASSEDKENIVCDIITYPDMDVLQRFYYDNMVSSAPGIDSFHRARKTFPSLVRYRLSGVPNSGTMAKAADVDLPRAEIVVSYKGPQVGDLPTINPQFATRKSRYVYNVTDRGLSSFFDGLAKVDMETGEYTIWSRDKHTPGEPIFVPSSPAIPSPSSTDDKKSKNKDNHDHEEDDEDVGHLLSVILDGEKGTSYLLCLDALTMMEVGRADCGLPVGIGIHGQHCPALVRM